MKTIITATDIKDSRKRGAAGGFTLAETLMAVVIAALLFGGMITAYLNATRNAEWTGYSLAAGALAIQQVEQARSGVWDPTIAKNECSNMMVNLNSYNYDSSTGIMTGYSWTNLDMPTIGGNFTRATNFVTITPLTISSGVKVQMVQVRTVWPFPIGKGYQLYTNTICTYLAPDNRDVSSL